MMQASMINVGIGTLGSGAKRLFSGIPGEVIGAVAPVMSTIGGITMMMSFILFYVLPFLPFIYFFFAISGWLRSIFEAIVAMPLWALAHVSRIDGEGIPGPAAMNGYFLIFEIFLRPVLIVFGLIASVSIFSAMVGVLNDIFDLVVDNIGGFNVTDGSISDYMRSPLDEFFMTAVYVIICYLLASNCFKMIDSIPNQILRFMGVSVQTLQETTQDAAGELTGKIFRGGAIIGGHAKGGALAALA